MRILLIGASGAVGSAVCDALAGRHEVVSAGRSHGDHRVDVTSDASVEALFAATGQVDAIVCTTGGMHFGPLATMRPSDFDVGLQGKLLGQIRVALIGQQALANGGSVTLTSGIDEPILHAVNASAVNAGVEGFVRAAAMELPRGLRINAVSPTVMTESLPVYGPFFPGFESVPAARVALAYVRSVEGPQTGRVYRVWQ
ncbi:MAG TPA: short chain dehydrogenase [Ideonella sp.]|jgi:NAD(P)-dependent dehydrogenase (short-subunit alcohol dehydrogenase family)|uniref:short chain dehydrogenase n=1 Tax=Ideonella sp. TaxID=1929293 RepID=UPI002E30A1F5|nr:short chain dehydrogenase [Ideonella sp.]HEX5685444.1 short chain dehydrogenase [Ideonella sp.]